MFWRLQALLCKTETVYGTDSAPTGAANAILCSNVKISPMNGSDVKRDFDRAYFGAKPTIPVGLHAKITFKVEAKGFGVAGTQPAFSPLLRAAKLAVTIVASTSVTYTPHSGTQESCTIYFNNDGTLYKMLGCRGSYTYEVDALGIVYLVFEMTGLFVQPSSAALPVVPNGAQLTQLPQVASTANTPVFTVGGVSLALRKFVLDAGCEVKPRFLIGAEEIMIVDAAESISMTVAAVPLATFNPYALAAAATPQAISLVHGVGAGKICTLTIPSAQIMRPDGLEEQDGITEWTLKMTPLPTAGNDQFTIAFT